MNSNYVVIIDRSNLYVYSLLALRSPLPSDAFVFKIKHNHEEVIDVLIDEAQIVCLGMRYFSLGVKKSPSLILDLDHTPIPTFAAP